MVIFQGNKTRSSILANWAWLQCAPSRNWPKWILGILSQLQTYVFAAHLILGLHCRCRLLHARQAKTKIAWCGGMVWAADRCSVCCANQQTRLRTGLWSYFIFEGDLIIDVVGAVYLNQHARQNSQHLNIIKISTQASCLCASHHCKVSAKANLPAFTHKGVLHAPLGKEMSSKLYTRNLQMSTHIYDSC